MDPGLPWLSHAWQMPPKSVGQNLDVSMTLSSSVETQSLKQAPFHIQSVPLLDNTQRLRKHPVGILGCLPDRHTRCSSPQEVKTRPLLPGRHHCESSLRQTNKRWRHQPPQSGGNLRSLFSRSDTSGPSSHHPGCPSSGRHRLLNLIHTQDQLQWPRACSFKCVLRKHHCIPSHKTG